MHRIRNAYLITGFLAGIVLCSRPVEAQYSTNFQTSLISGVLSNWSGDYIVGSNTFADVLQIQSGGELDDLDGILGYEAGSSNDSVLVTGSGSLWDHGASLLIGWSGANESLTVASGGRVFNKAGFLGYDIGSTNNHVLVTGSGSVWSNRYDLNVGFSGMGNSLVVSNGGKAINGYASGGTFVGPCFIGYNESSSGNCVVVTGSGSVWSNNWDLYLGYSGAGNSLIVSNGGQVSSVRSIFGYTSSSSNNSALISGTNSIWYANNGLDIGRGGYHNRVVIRDGGQVASGGNDAVGDGTSSNSVLVTDPGSSWTIPLSLHVGSASTGNSVIITNGGHVLTGYYYPNLYYSSASIGDNASSSSNFVLVSGSGSVWSNIADLYVGSSGWGNRMLVVDAGQVASSNSYVGYSSGSSSAVIAGTNSMWAIGNHLYVGYDGVGNGLVISNGGVVIDSFGAVGETSGDSSNFVLVTGPGSTWSNRNSVTIGWDGADNSLVISNGGAVVSDVGRVGMFSTGAASARVVDGAVWQNNVLHVGESGTSNSLVVAGGTVFATNLTIGFSSIGCGSILQLDSGSVVVTNATHDAVLEVRRGKLVLNGGVLRVDKLVMRDPCGLFIPNGGTLIAGSLVLAPGSDADGDGIPNIWEQTHGSDPLNPADANQDSGSGMTYLQVYQQTSNVDSDGDGSTLIQELVAGTDPSNSASFFHVTSLVHTGNNIRVSWTAAGGRSYVVQTNSVPGAGFIDLSPTITVPGVGETSTNYLHLNALSNGALTNNSVMKRFYRVRVAP